MARDHARIYSSIWSDPDFLALNGEPQRVYLMLMSQANLNYAGVISLTAKRWVRYAKDSTAAKLRKSLDELQASRHIVVDEDTEELLIRKFLRWDRVLRQPNVAVAAVKGYRSTSSPLLRAAWLVEFRRLVEDDRIVIEGDGKKELAAKVSTDLSTVYYDEPFPEGFPEGFPKGLYEARREGWWKGFPEPPTRAAPTPTNSPAPTPRLSAVGWCQIHGKAELCPDCERERRAS